jgi:hypothetical protein
MLPEVAHARRDLGELLLRSGEVDSGLRELNLAVAAYRSLRMDRHSVEAGALAAAYASTPKSTNRAIEERVETNEISIGRTGAQAR